MSYEQVFVPVIRDVIDYYRSVFFQVETAVYDSTIQVKTHFIYYYVTIVLANSRSERDA